MEYASGGELFDYIVSQSRLAEIEACTFFQQILSGVEYIHKLGVVHRDLKPENLLLDSKKNIKIVDFGLSNTYKPGELLQTACGSPCYAAPEMIAGHKYLGSRVDLWSCGVILFAMLSGYLPFEDPNTSELYKKILSCEYETPEWVSTLSQDMLRCILNTDPDSRHTIAQIRKHPWFKQVYSECSLGILIGYNPIPINKEILKKLEGYGFDLEHSEKCIEANKHNQITTTYYLLMKKYQAGPGIVEMHSEKNIAPHPPMLPFAPIAEPSVKLSLKHRKYIEKKVESTGGSSFHELDIPRHPVSPKIAPSAVSIVAKKIQNRGNSPNVKQVRGRRYVSAGRVIPKEPAPPSRNKSKPARISTKKFTIKTNSSRKSNKSVELRHSEIKNSNRISPKFRDSKIYFSKGGAAVYF